LTLITTPFAKMSASNHGLVNASGARLLTLLALA
jgi:hypothetical protein